MSAKAIKVVNGVKTAKWWRVVDLHAGFGKIEATATATTNMPQYQNNPIVNVVDGNADSKFWSNRKTQANDYVMLSFSAPKFIDTVYLKQGDADKFTASKLYYTTDAAPAADGKWTELPAPTSASEQTITFDRVEATGVKLVSTAATDSWFQLFEFNAFEKFSYSKDSLYASFDLAGVNLAARVGDGSFKTTDGSVTLPKKGDVIAVDLGSVRREVVLANAACPGRKGGGALSTPRTASSGARSRAPTPSAPAMSATAPRRMRHPSTSRRSPVATCTPSHLASLRASCPAPRPSTPPRSSTATSPPPPSPAVAPPRAPRSFSTWARSARSRALSTSSPRPVSITSAMP
ncbi:MAG: discoidin domain-containing protein [Collinsella sp.]